MKRFTKNIIIYLVIFGLVLGAAVMYRGGSGHSAEKVKYSTMVQYLSQGKVSEVNISDSKVTARIGTDQYVYCYATNIVDMQWLEEKYIFKGIASGKISYESKPPSSANTVLQLLPTIIMVIALGFLFYLMMNQGGNGKAFQFGKSKARMYKGEGKKITFEDVAGLKEEKEELEEVVDFLKDPRKYREVGARIPKGILLVGPPGTGKTYVSRATAGEAGVPFFTISGSDFVEMFVGVGASRVRDLFDQAKKNAPCIVFIDEIDAVGRKRGAGLGGGNDEREQTLNQLLVEMDGFGENSGIIILAATNRPDVLDPALLRPGRFDRQIVIGIPDVKGREEIIRVHSKDKPLSEEVSPEILARRTPGFTPADLENLLNEAALITARRNGRKIRMAEIEEATTKVMAGPAKKSRVISEAEKKLTAYHEAGHAIVMRSIPGSDPVHQITIIPRGSAGGFTMSLPKEDKYFETKQNMIHSIMHLLGGRVAEALTLDDISTGASNDIQRATDIARDMVTKYGFSDKIGPVNYSDSDDVFLGRDFSKTKAYSEGVATEIDEEVRRIIRECYSRTESILKDNMDKLEVVAKALMRVETLDGEQFEELYSGKINDEELEQQVREKEEEIRRQNAAEAAETERIRKEEAEKLAAELAKYDTDYLNDEEPADAEEQEAGELTEGEEPSLGAASEAEAAADEAAEADDPDEAEGPEYHVTVEEQPEISEEGADASEEQPEISEGDQEVSEEETETADHAIEGTESEEDENGEETDRPQEDQEGR